MTQLIKKSVEDWVSETNYKVDPTYIPSTFALEFVTFIKLVNGEKGEEHQTPVVHYHMLDQIAGDTSNIVNMCSRGLAKSAILAEYLFLYIAVYGEIPGFGQIDYALYVSDSIDNGVKKMRLRMENRRENSDFLKKYIPRVRFTDTRWEFENSSKKKFVVTGHGIKTGVRGTVELNTRPQLAILDDLISDEDARSDTVISAVEDIVHKAVDYAMHPTKSKVIWSGTPFNSKDPLYKAVESGAWLVNVYPVCEIFPCTEEEFRSAWPDRFPYEYVKAKYSKAVLTGKVADFNQELMLRIMSDEERLILDCDIQWYEFARVRENLSKFNIYITTDFATTERTSGDFSVIAVWGLNYRGDWFWIDGIVKKQLMDKNIDDLFRLAQKYMPQSVGIEISGQQKGFIRWIQGEMISRNIYFTIASDGKDPGISPNTNKIQRFSIVVPWFKAKQIWFPEEKKNDPELIEYYTELSLAAFGKFKSKHDDCLDSISQLASLKTWRPSQDMSLIKNDKTGIWELDEDDEDTCSISSYVV